MTFFSVPAELTPVTSEVRSVLEDGVRVYVCVCVCVHSSLYVCACELVCFSVCHVLYLCQLFSFLLCF